MNEKEYKFTLILRGHTTFRETVFDGDDFLSISNTVLYRANFVSKPWFQLMRRGPGEAEAQIWTFPTLDEFVAFRQGFEEARR